MSKDIITCHNGAPFSTVGGFVMEWEEKHHGPYPSPYDHCSYCGSISFADLLQVMKEGGKVGGSDYKYGWPHKFYVYVKDGSMEKFYNLHLLDLPRETLEEFAPLLLENTGIEFFYRDDKLAWSAPYQGYQR